jgi:hypothetical protein
MREVFLLRIKQVNNWKFSVHILSITIYNMETKFIKNTKLGFQFCVS